VPQSGDCLCLATVLQYRVRVPHPTTLMKLTRWCGKAAAGFNKAAWTKAAGATLLRSWRLRADMTVWFSKTACGD
jgi:IS5 family transposase